MAKTLTISQDNFSRGLQLLTDDSKAAFGSARNMVNCIITDRGGIAPRPGTELLGTHNTSLLTTKGLYNFRKSKSNPDILIKGYDDELEYFHPTLKTWNKLKDGFTSDQEFDFAYSLVNVDNDDFTYFCNAYEEYQRWSGAYTQLDGALSGAETEVTVDSVLTTQTYLSETATSNSATTLTVSGATWATDMWKNFYIYIPATGKVRLITGNNGTVLTFSTLGAGPGNVAFQIRQLAFPLSGTIIYNGTNIAYTTIDIATQFPVTSAHAASDNAAVAVIPTEYIDAPRGNRIDTLRGRVYVGHVKSALSRDSGGGIQGSSQAGGVFVSALLDPTDFTFAATRVAGEGDIINVAYGGSDITDVQAFEDEVAFYKKDYIELVKYTEDVNDTAIRTPLKTGVGSLGRVIKGTDDHYFMTPDGKYTSLGRVRQKDITPQSENLGYIIKRLLDTYNSDNFTGQEFNNRIISAHKSSDSVANNDVMLVYNNKTKSFEGIWNIGANNFDTFKGVSEKAAELVYGESNGANVWKMFQTDKSDVRDATTKLPYSAIWQSNFFNVLPIKSNIQAINSIAVEGYITADTTYTCKLFKDFETDSMVDFTFGGTEEDFMQGPNDLARFFGSHPFATTPIGSVSDPDSDGRRRFSFIAYFPYKYCQYLSTEFSSTGVNQDWEIIRTSYGLKEDVSVRTSNTKTI
tara:strand:- start:2979 stop:5045 length:2067 start_codon:yes stop_codon:yes gene_type:complete